jgi:hypothetical protein
LAEGLAFEVRVDESQASQTTQTDSPPGKFRDKDRSRVAYDHQLDFTLAIHERADLSPDFPGELGKLSRKLLSHDFSRGYAFGRQLFQSCLL